MSHDCLILIDKRHNKYLDSVCSEVHYCTSVTGKGEKVDILENQLLTFVKSVVKEPCPLHHHSNNTGHPTSQDNFHIIGREGHGLARDIKESISIRVNNPTLNRNIGSLIYPTYGIGSYLIHLVLL